MRFFNREIEVAELQRIQRLSVTDHSRMTVITGRRRIGKTSLIKKALADIGYPMLYFFVGRKAEADLVEDFRAELSAKLDTYVPEGMTSITSLLKYVFSLGKSTKFTLVIDEFQELVNVAPSTISDLQNIWDSNRQETHVNMVLSGSVQSMMKKIFTDAHEPLFGRADNILHLKPFKINVLKEIMSEYYPDFDNDDLLALYSFTGGIPKYVEIFCDNRILSQDKMIDFIASPMSPFIDEGRNLLINEFGKDYGVYFSILQAISEGYTSQSEISKALGEISIGGHLEKLEKTYGIIAKYQPLFAKQGAKNSVRFRISDLFLLFWFRFIERNRAMVELDNFIDLREIITKHYPTYSGYTLERYFRQKLAEEGGFREIASWWLPKLGLEASEIDIVGIRSSGKKALVAEVKRRKRNDDHKKFMEKVERIKASILDSYEIETRLLTTDEM